MIKPAALKILAGALAIGAAAAPFTGGTSLGVSALVAAPVAASTGLSLTTVVAISVLGMGFVLAIFGDYDEIEFDAKGPRVKLKKNNL